MLSIIILVFCIKEQIQCKQVDVLPSKNQAMCKLNHCQSTAIQCIVIVINDITSKSCEQRLITKEHIATYTNLILLFKPVLYSSTLVIKVVLSRILTITL